MPSPLTIALPKGRIQQELAPLLQKAGIHPEQAYFDDSERQLQFSCRDSDMRLIRVRSFDVATFVAFGAAQIGIAGLDVLMEFDYSDLYAPLDLNIGHCRLSVAEPEEGCGDVGMWGYGEKRTISASPHPHISTSHLSHLRVATKYPNVTRKYFAAQGIQAECIKLSGAMELAPKLGLAPRIVDLVSTGRTLKANGLREAEKIADISSRLIVGRAAFKTRSAEIHALIEKFREAVDG